MCCITNVREHVDTACDLLPCFSLKERQSAEQHSTHVLTKSDICLQEDLARSELHALGFVDGHEGQHSLSVKFYLQASAQESKAGQNR